MKFTTNLLLVTILGLLLVSTSVEARRRSRIDLPIENPAEAPLEDNLATASGSDVVVEKFEVPPPTSLKKEEKEGGGEEEVSSSEDSSSAECKSDNISFELITG